MPMTSFFSGANKQQINWRAQCCQSYHWETTERSSRFGEFINCCNTLNIIAYWQQSAVMFLLGFYLFSQLGQVYEYHMCLNRWVICLLHSSIYMYIYYGFSINRRGINISSFVSFNLLLPIINNLIYNYGSISYFYFN